MAVSEWFYRRNGRVYGPVSLADLQAAVTLGFVGMNDLVRQRLSGEWRPAATVEQLAADCRLQAQQESGLTGLPDATQEPERNGFTLVELLVVVAIIATLMALLLPAVQNARESARNVLCKSNLHQVGLAVIAYTEVHTKYPTGLGFHGERSNCAPLNKETHGRYFWTYSVMPFLELTEVQALIDPRTYLGHMFLGGEIDANSTTACQTLPIAYKCPSDFHIPCTTSNDWKWDRFTRSNYVACFSPHGFCIEPEANVPCLIVNSMNGGQKTTANPTVISESPLRTKQGRSIFNVSGVERKPAKVTDGLSKTVMVSEVISSGGLLASTYFDGRGTWWLDQGVMYSHYLTPNTPQNDPYHGDNIGEVLDSGKPGLPNTQTAPGGWPAVMNAARSNHPGGVNAVMGDGSVRFVEDNIASVIWSALGSMDGGDSN